MTLRFMDGFDAYAASGASCQIPMVRKWANVNSTAATFTAGRTVGLAINSSSTTFTSPAFTSQPTWVVGFAFYRPTAANNYVVIRFEDTTTTQCSLLLNTSNRFALYRGNAATLLATGTTTISTLTWYYVELKVTINNATGAMELRLNGSGSAEVSVSGTDTQISTNASANKIIIVGNTAYYDDLYLLDSTGATNNDFLGDMKIETIRPNAAGTNSGWALGAGVGTNYERVDEQAVDDDLSYVHTSVVNTLDLYNFPNLSTVKSRIKAIGTNISISKDSAGTKTMAPVIRAGGPVYTNYDGVAVAAYDSYLNLGQIYETNPDTTSSWATSGVNTSEYGERIIS